MYITDDILVFFEDTIPVTGIIQKWMVKFHNQ